VAPSPNGVSDMAQALAGAIFWFSFVFCFIGVLSSGGLWAVGAFSNNYTQSVNGKRSFLICAISAVALLASGAAMNLAFGGSPGSALQWFALLIAIALFLTAISLPVAVLGFTLSLAGPLVKAALEVVRRAACAARQVIASSARRCQLAFVSRRERLLLDLAGLFIPRICRAQWKREAVSTLHEAATPQQRRAWLRDLAIKAPWMGLQLFAPRLAERALTAQEMTIRCRNPKQASKVVMSVIERVILSTLGYSCLSVTPSIYAAIAFYLADGWSPVLENMDNILAMGVIVQFPLAAARRQCKRASRKRPRK
jgi:hypothetical protein